METPAASFHGIAGPHFFRLHALLKRAAEVQGRTMTDFVIGAVQEAAQRAIPHKGARSERRPRGIQLRR